MRAGISWSGGKESCLALWHALEAGYAVKALVNMASEKTGRCCFHGLARHVLNAQARALGIPLAQGIAPADMAGYEQAFKKTILSVAGLDAMIFGDVYLEEHKSWIERVCNEIRIQPIEPLWNREPGELVGHFIELGFRAVIVSCDARLLDRNFCGRPLDKAAIEEITRLGLCPCGEHGEYHTFVIDGPIFKRRVSIVSAEVVRLDGAWPRWAYDVKKVRLQAKRRLGRPVLDRRSCRPKKQATKGGHA